MKLYLACPFFNIDEILKYEAAIEGLRARGYEVQVLCGEPNTTYSMMMISSANKVVEYRNVEYWEEVSAEVNLNTVIQK